VAIRGEVYEVFCTPVLNGPGEAYGGHIMLKVTQEVQDRQRLWKAMRAVSVVNRTTHALLYAEDEAELLERICGILEDQPAIAAGWIGLCTEADCAALTLYATPHGPGTAPVGGRLAADDGDPRAAELLRRVVGEGRTVLANTTLPGEEVVALPAVLTPEGHTDAAALVTPVHIDGRRAGMLAVRAEEADAFDAEDIRLYKELAADLGYGLGTLRTRAAYQASQERLERALEGTIRAIAGLMEERDPYTAGHQARVADLAGAIGRELGLGADRIQGLELGAYIHNLGKMHVPSDILNKPGRLSDAEIALVREHPASGEAIVADQAFPWPVADMVRHHHERLDGSGYPDGLSGEAISLEARILAVADVVEAMASHRPYRPALGLDTALDQIEAERGTRLDAEVVDACLALFREGRFAFSAA
jgi:HD-GYP domain-containing protein (c-di-GMP phosphodiesterase class II)